MRRGAAVVLVAVTGQWACTGDGTGDDAPEPDAAGEQAAQPDTPDVETGRQPARLARVPAGTTIVPADGPVPAATAISATLFERAPVVVVAPEGAPGPQAQAASAALALGVPFLLSPGPAAAGTAADAAGPAAAGTGAQPAAGTRGAGAAVTDELERLAPRTVLAFGNAARDWAQPLAAGGVEVVDATDDPGIARALGGSGRGEGRSVARTEPSDDVLVLVDGAGAGTAAVATARAGGARVVAVAGPDPRADPAAIAALAAAPLPDRVVALGSAFGSPELLRPRLEVAATGVQLPGGGQVLFPFRRMVALYGHPGAPVLGVLGEQGPDAAVARAQQMAAGYHGLAGEPIVPAFEIITTVASAAPGADGDYSDESAVADLRPWVDAAARAGVYVVLDLQPGRTDFLTQAQRYAELLAEPHVGLALDPEWRLGPGQLHMRQIGSVGVDEVNAVAAWLAQFTRERRLPQKLLLLHQFQLRMIVERGRLDTTHDELAVLVHADGFGTHGQKLDTWNALRSEPVPNAWWGWKNFIDEDQPTFTPAETYALDTAPWFVSYQ